VTGLVHLVAVGVLGVVVALATGVVTLPGSLLAGYGTGLLWYVLGFAVVGTICRTRRTAMWLLAGLIVVFVLSTILLTADPGGTATAVLSVLPPFAPVLLPGRLVVGVASAWQVPLAVGLTLVLLAGLTAKRISLP
jgi:ABC-2 type transport system permease protein